jgi:hypothetical protein
MKKIFNYQTYKTAGNERGTKGKKRERPRQTTDYNSNRNDERQTPAACGGTPFRKGAVLPRRQEGGRASTTKTTNHNGKNIDHCRGGFQTLPYGHLRDNKTAGGQHETERMIAVRDLKNVRGCFFCRGRCRASSTITATT